MKESFRWLKWQKDSMADAAPSGEACMGHTSGEQNTVGECPHTLAAHCMLGGLGDPHERGAASRHYSHRGWDASWNVLALPEINNKTGHKAPTDVPDYSLVILGSKLCYGKFPPLSQTYLLHFPRSLFRHSVLINTHRGKWVNVNMFLYNFKLYMFLKYSKMQCWLGKPVAYALHILTCSDINRYMSLSSINFSSLQYRH